MVPRRIGGPTTLPCECESPLWSSSRPEENIRSLLSRARHFNGDSGQRGFVVVVTNVCYSPFPSQHPFCFLQRWYSEDCPVVEASIVRLRGTQRARQHEQTECESKTFIRASSSVWTRPSLPVTPASYFSSDNAAACLTTARARKAGMVVHSRGNCYFASLRDADAREVTSEVRGQKAVFENVTLALASLDSTHITRRKSP